MELVLSKGDFINLRIKETNALVSVSINGDTLAVFPVLSYVNDKLNTDRDQQMVTHVIAFSVNEARYLNLLIDHSTATLQDFMRPDWKNVTFRSLHMDTLDFVGFFSALETEYDIDFDQEYLEKLETVGAVYHYVLTLAGNPVPEI